MHLQLFQLTCKCGHLHLGRKRRGQTGAEQEGRGRATLGSTTNTLPDIQPVTLLLQARQTRPQRREVPRDWRGPSRLTWHQPPAPGSSLLAKNKSPSGVIFPSLPLTAGALRWQPDQELPLQLFHLLVFLFSFFLFFT